MIFNLSCGGGGANLNFKFQTAEPTGSENLIWFKTATAATDVYIEADYPSNPNSGDIFVFENEHSHVTIDMGMGHLVNLLFFGEAYQWDGTVWNHIEGYIYQSNVWVQFSGAVVSFIQVTTTEIFTSLSCTNGVESHSDYTDIGNNTYEFEVFNTGTWSVTITDGTNTFTDSVVISGDNQIQTITLSYRVVPKISYTGTYRIVDDAGNVLDESSASDMKTQNWRIRFLTSGTLTFLKLGNAKDGIDLFAVGGGGGGKSYEGGGSYWGCAGGGGGYTKTVKNKVPLANIGYTVTIGAGGAVDSEGGTSSFGSLISANGGKGGVAHGTGGAGGSGGGAGSNGAAGGAGGSNGGNGGAGGSSGTGGAGQGTTTREFGESSGTLYAGGGGGGTSSTTASHAGSGGSGGGGQGAYADGASSAGTANTGGGGGGSSAKNGAASKAASKGGSGIIVIRNARG